MKADKQTYSKKGKREPGGHNILLAVKRGRPDEVFWVTEENTNTEHVKARLFKWEVMVCLMALCICQTLSGSA